MKCEHNLVDVWGSGRAPVAVEVTRDEAEELIAASPQELYMHCAQDGCELEVE